MSLVGRALARILSSKLHALVAEGVGATDAQSKEAVYARLRRGAWRELGHVETALRRAQLSALATVISAWQAREPDTDTNTALFGHALAWAETELSNMPPAALELEGSAKVESDAESAAVSEGAARKFAEEVVWQELSISLMVVPDLDDADLPDAFQEAYSGHAPGITGWYEQFLAQTSAALASDEKFKQELLSGFGVADTGETDLISAAVARFASPTSQATKPLAATLASTAAALAAAATTASASDTPDDYDTTMEALMQRVWSSSPATRGMPRPVMRTFLAELATLDLADDQIPPLVEKKLMEYQSLGKRWATPVDTSTEAGGIWSSARQLARESLDAGDFAGAHYAFADASETLSRLATRNPRIEAEVLGEEANALKLSWAYHESATRLKMAAERVAAEPAASARWWQRAAEVLFVQGKEFVDNGALKYAITIWRSRLAASSREAAPLDWAATQNHLGNALKCLGENENSKARLEEAVGAYREALQGSTRERAPLDWATTQHNLGNALLVLGELENNTARLHEAINAQREALQEYTHDRSPAPWAMTQICLGNALKALGDAENSGPRFIEAVDAFTLALQEYSREHAPMQWAMTQNNLGSALLALGKCENSTARFDEAEVAYRAALTERTRLRSPMQWAMTLNNLGNVLLARGRNEADSDRLSEAETAFRDALTERTRERAPMQWAMTQNNLGNALLALGKRENSSKRFAAAAAAYRDALNERTAERAAMQWAMTQNNLANALCSWFALTSEPRLLDDALTAVDGAKEILQTSPHYLGIANRVRERIVALQA